jgi:hypothetical protein
MWRTVSLAAALTLAFAIFFVAAVTPRPASVDAAPSAFSAARAIADVRVIGATPHPVGSRANDAVRDYLVARMTALGLDPRVQHASAFAAYGSRASGATVDNVIGILPGRNRAAPAVALMAHHDSVAGSPGAADDTAGAASALEIVRAIKADGVPARDVMVVITDGEEAGLLGARAFFDKSPLAAHVGYVLNLETRGGGGRAVMFETAPANGADIALYRRTAVSPVSNALTVFAYRHMPNSTDFTVALGHGKVGLNYAFIGRQFDYHSPSSTVAVLDQGALQHMGAQVLPTARALAFGALPGRAPDIVYGNLVGDITAAYPAGFGWILLAASAALIGVGAARAGRVGAFRAGDVARGAGASLYALSLCGGLLELARRLTAVPSSWMGYRPILAQFPLFEVMMLLGGLGGVLATVLFLARGRSRVPAAGLALLAGLAASALDGWSPAGLVFGGVGAVVGALAFGGPARLPGAWTGALAVVFIAAAVAQVLAPTAGAAFAWPLAAGALASGITAAGAARKVLGSSALVVIAALALAWIGGLFHQLLEGLDLPLVATLPTWLAALFILPLAFPGDSDLSPVRFTPIWIPTGLIILALVVAMVIRFDRPWTARYPNAVEPLYVVDPAGRKAWRVSLLPPDSWTLGVLRAEGGAVGRLDLPFGRRPLAATPASVTPADPPQVSMTVGADGMVDLVARPHPGARELWLAVRSPAGARNVSINGEPSELVLGANRWTVIRWSGPEGFTLAFRPDGPGAQEVLTGKLFDRWLEARALPKPPPTDQLWDLAGSTLVIGRVGRR